MPFNSAIGSYSVLPALRAIKSKTHPVKGLAFSVLCAPMAFFYIHEVRCPGPGDRRRLTNRDGVPSWFRDCGQTLRPTRACPPPGQSPLPGDSTTALDRRGITLPTRFFWWHRGISSNGTKNLDKRSSLWIGTDSSWEVVDSRREQCLRAT